MKYIKSKEGTEYDIVIKTILKYIMYVRKCDKKLNQHVPNKHIADIFKEYLVRIDLESKFTNEYKYVEENHHNITSIGNNDPKDYVKQEDGSYSKTTIRDMRLIGYMKDYFDSSRLRKYGIDEINKTYQKLREKNDDVRNLKALQTIIMSYDYTHPDLSKYMKLKTTDLR